jgi:hypothetical protein
MRARTLIVTLVAVLLVAAAVIVFSSITPATSPQLSFSCVGYTIGPTGARCAIVVITNDDRFAISFGSRGSYIWFDSTNTPVGAASSTEITPDVPAGGSQEVFVSMPPHSVRCGMEVWVTRQTPIARFMEATTADRCHLPFLNAPPVYGIRSSYIIE